MVKETVINVTVDGCDPEVQHRKSIPIQQSTESAPIEQTVIDKNQTNEKCDRQHESLEATKANVNGKYQSEDECEQSLVPPPVYQKTTEHTDNKKYPHSSRLNSIVTLKSLEKIRGVNCRTVLWYVTFVGFMVNYMYRITINIAIVDMVAIRKVTPLNQYESECFVAEITNSTMNDVKNNMIDDKTTFAWNELDQNRVLGSFFWLHWAPQVLGGVLAPRYGTKLLFGLSNFLCCLLSVFIPMVSKWHVNYLVALRIVQGIISGVAWPAMHHLSSQWIPPNERSKFLSSYSGSSIGVAIFYPLFGFLINTWSWESIFYFTGVFGSVWYAAWLYFVYDSPAQHPRIDPTERNYIEAALSDSVHSGKKDTPWRPILGSWPVWSNIIGQFGGIWGLFTMMTQAPTYFRIIHGWGVQMTGFLSGFPHLCRMIFAYVFSIFIDYLLRNDKMSRTNVRKLASAVATIVNGIFVIGLAFSGCSSTIAVAFLTLATIVHGAVSSGQLAGLIDISPNFSGITLGLNGLVGVWPGFISPYIVGKLTFGNQSVQQWQYVFFICAAVLFVTGFINVWFSDSTLQSWNQPKTETKSSEEKEMILLNDTQKNGLSLSKELHDDISKM